MNHAFISQPCIITTHWPVFISYLAEYRRPSSPRRLVTYQDGIPIYGNQTHTNWVQFIVTVDMYKTITIKPTHHQNQVHFGENTELSGNTIGQIWLAIEYDQDILINILNDTGKDY